jgi:hypothetical protein
MAIRNPHSALRRGSVPFLQCEWDIEASPLRTSRAARKSGVAQDYLGAILLGDLPGDWFLATMTLAGRSTFSPQT